MEHFIYVFSPEAKEKLSKMGYTLIQQDEVMRVFVFLNDPKRTFNFSETGFQFTLSDTLCL